MTLKDFLLLLVLNKIQLVSMRLYIIIFNTEKIKSSFLPEIIGFISA